MCELVNGPVPSQDHEAAHSCGKGDTGCVNPAHLAWKTRSENNNQKTKHGTQLRGTKQPMAKLDELQVREIRKMKGRANYIEISAKYGISKQQVCRIMKRQAWAWL
jgi:DNA-directed RNA polymerase specialized sigma subunit